MTLHSGGPTASDEPSVLGWRPARVLSTVRVRPGIQTHLDQIYRGHWCSRKTFAIT